MLHSRTALTYLICWSPPEQSLSYCNGTEGALELNYQVAVAIPSLVRCHNIRLHQRTSVH